MHPLERLLNLVALLLESPRPLPFTEIREKLPAYAQQTPDSAKRMFERDKDVLRDNGIPVDLVATDVWEVEEGYTIPKDRYYLPEVTFSASEISALFVAAHTPGDEDEAEQAVRKLSVAADEPPLGALTRSPLTAGADPGGPMLVAVANAIGRRRRVAFRYRPSSGEQGERRVDPYALVWRTGHWYVVGMDADRGEPRSFRLSRFLSEPEDVGEGSSPPEGFDAGRQLKAGPWGLGEPGGRAIVAFSPDAAWWATAGVPGATVVRTREDGWVETSVPASDAPSFVSWVLSFGPDAELVEPEDLRAEVVARLEATLAGL
jgi:proteasome accessory factor B